MIPDWEKNKVYFSNLLLLQFPDEFRRITLLLDKHNIPFDLLEGTRDIWCRDYMPVQITEKKVVQFEFKPSYLKDEIDLQSIPSEFKIPECFEIEKSTINLDGGNITCSPSKVILTNRIFKENKNLNYSEIKNGIELSLDCSISLVQDVKNDMTGHIDGHLRFIDENSIVVNELSNELKYWQQSFHKMIEESKLKYVEMPWFIPYVKSSPESAVGSYVNYLHLDNLIIFPIFGCNGNKDNEALRVIQTLFPNHQIEPIIINSIAEKGGLMNCITWTVKE
jgi:agmatine deiminase